MKPDSGGGVFSTRSMRQCRAFQVAIDILGRPWTARAKGPTDKVLSARLKELEAKKLVSRQVDPGPPVKVASQLTPRCRAFGEVTQAIEKWGRTLA